MRYELDDYTIDFSQEENGEWSYDLADPSGSPLEQASGFEGETIFTSGILDYVIEVVDWYVDHFANQHQELVNKQAD